jgi:general secretion pathway protein A
VYTKFFGLNEKPFAITPDPRYLYMSQRHADALAHLLYGVSESGGFIQLTGEVGTGKTTLIRSLLVQLPEKSQIALVLNPQLSTREFLHSICDELGVAVDREDSFKGMVDRLNTHLLAAHAGGQRTVLIVDEAQNLSLELLEQIRLLTNLETAKHKLLQIILIGQPELREMLARRDMRQIAQRITGRYHLEPLSREDTAAYVQHRLKVAGAQTWFFSDGALKEIFLRSTGIPRLINVIADRALLAAYAQQVATIDRRLVRASAAEVFGARGERRAWSYVAGGAALVLIGTAGVLLWPHAEMPAPQPRVADAQSPAVPAEPTPAEVLAVAEPTAPSLKDLFAEQALSSSVDASLSDLFDLWGVSYEPAAAPACEQAASLQLSCLYLHGSISELRRANRPAILTLRDEHGDEFPVVLRALGSDEVELLSAGRLFTVDLGDLTYYWYGDQLLLWRPGAPQGKDLLPGVRDPGVAWLRETLAKIDGITGPAEPSLLYDTALQTRVREYQHSRRLTVDGIVGAQTQLALMSELETTGVPTLSWSH